MKTAKKKALLILVGGRQMPNLLMAQALQPEVIVPIASPEGKRDVWKNIESAINRLGESIIEPKITDAIELSEIKRKCKEAISEFPDHEWFFNVTCATTVMSIGAFEVAKENNLTAWYLDTNTRRVAVLSGQPPKTEIYSVKISDYLLSYGRKVGESGNYKSTENLKNYARQLASDSSVTNAFQQSLL